MKATSCTINEGADVDDFDQPLKFDHPEEPETTDEDDTTKLSEKDSIAPSMDIERILNGACRGDDLFGRNKERSELLKSYNEMKEGGPNTLVLISGPAGAGKTVLAESVRAFVQKDLGYCMSVTFDTKADMVAGPRVMVAVLDKMIASIIAKGQEAMDAVKVAVEQSADIDIAALVEVVPSLKAILGDDHGELTFSRLVDHSCRKTLIIRAFFQAICSPTCPVVLIANNVESADPFAVSILRYLMFGAKKCMLFVATCRQQVTDSAKSLLEGLQNEGVVVKNIALENLNEATTARMVSNLLITTPDSCVTVSNSIFQYSSGNPLFIVELLRFLYETDLIVFDEASSNWSCNPQLTDSVIQNFQSLRDVLIKRLLLETKGVQELLKVAACLGYTLNEHLLSIALSAPVSQYVSIAADHGLLSYIESGGYYCFANNAVYEASYSLISANELSAFHVAIGRKIWRGLDEEVLPEYVPQILFQVNHGISLIKSPREKYALATFHLQVAETAAKKSNFSAASIALDGAVRLLSKNHWSEQYELSLSIFNYAAEVEYTRGNFEKVNEYIDEIQRNAVHLDDMLQAKTTKIQTLIAKDKFGDATDAALEALSQLGETFPLRPSHALIQIEFMKTRRLLRGRSDENLLRLPTMRDTRKGAAMQLMNAVFSSVYLAKPMLGPLLCFRMIRLTLQHGLCAISSFAFTTYGMLLCGYSFDFKGGYRYGQLALKLLDRFAAKEWLPRVYAGVFGIIHGWNLPMESALEPLSRAVRVGLETGDIEFACLNAAILNFMQFDLGKPLQELKAQIEKNSSEMRMLKQESSVKMQESFLHMVNVFLDLDEGAQVRQFQSNHGIPDNWIHCHKCATSYIFGDFEMALAEGNLAQRCGDPPYKGVDIAFGIVFHGLACLAVCQTAGNNQRKLIANAKRHMKLIERISHGAPEYCLGKLFLLRAELSVVRGQFDKARSEYISAIALATKSALLMDLGVANERAGRFMQMLGDPRGLPLLNEAVVVFEKWGAKSKARMLREKLAVLL